MKNQKGITLIALVITIIVLLILAGITIAMLTGENGILTNATKSKAINELGAAKDIISLKANEAVTDYFETTYVTGSTPQYSNNGVRTKVATEVNKLTDHSKGLPDGVTMDDTMILTSGSEEYVFRLTYGDYSVYGGVNHNGSLSWGETKLTKDFGTPAVADVTPSTGN